MAIVILAKATPPDDTRPERMNAMNWRSDAQSVLRRARRVAGDLGRRWRLLPYQTERKSASEWTADYATGRLDFYGSLEELSRYSVLAGYIGWTRRSRDAPLRVLDVGCGSGLLPAVLDDKLWSEYVGVDLSESAIAAARAAPIERTRYLVGDVMTLD